MIVLPMKIDRVNRKDQSMQTWHLKFSKDCSVIETGMYLEAWKSDKKYTIFPYTSINCQQLRVRVTFLTKSLWQCRSISVWICSTTSYQLVHLCIPNKYVEKLDYFVTTDQINKH